ncbi:MAG: transcriptional regulator [Bacillus subtilis]|nr:transcriptional regulator [Bacillus subtilis]
MLFRYLKENPLPWRMVPMSDDLRRVTELDRLIHEPARLLIVTILSTVESADFLFLQRETGLTKGNLLRAPQQTGGCWLCENSKDLQGQIASDRLQVDYGWHEGGGAIPPAVAEFYGDLTTQ